MVLTSPKKVVYVSLEYRANDVFSGNGVVARAHVRGLARQHIEILVICAKPRNGNDRPGGKEEIGVKIRCVDVDKWFTTDRESSWMDFAKDGANVLEQEGVFEGFDAIMAVDWTGMRVIEHYVNGGGAINCPVMYWNFRVYCSMGGITDDDRMFYKQMEVEAVKGAINCGGGVVALCDADLGTLKRMSEDADVDDLVYGEGGDWDERFRVVPPMLREELLRIAREEEDVILDFGRERMYLVSLVRLSEDKGPHRFVKMLQKLQQDDPQIWDRIGVRPLICGAVSQPEYARRLKEELKATVPQAVIMDKFLNPHELAEVLKNSVVNVHAATYEAYGMTIVEAGAMGCPTVLNESGIGASQLMDPRHKASVCVDVTNEAMLVDTVRKLLEHKDMRIEVAHSAYLHATSWTEIQHVRALIEFTSERIAAVRRTGTGTSASFLESF